MEWLIIAGLVVNGYFLNENLTGLYNQVEGLSFEVNELLAANESEEDTQNTWLSQMDEEVGFLQTAYGDFEDRVQVLEKVNKGKILKLGARL
jgi:hypothetical protein